MAGTFRGSAWIPEGRLRYGRPARGGCSAAWPRDGTEAAAGTGAARGLSTSTLPLASEGRNRRGVAARGGRLRGEHHEVGEGQHRAGHGNRVAQWRDGLAAASTTGSTSDVVPANRQHPGHGPPCVPRTREPRREAGRTGSATGSGGASDGPRWSRGRAERLRGPTPGAASADGRGLMFRAVRAPQPAPGGWLSGRGRRESRAHGETRGGGGATGRDDPARGRDGPPRR